MGITLLKNHSKLYSDGEIFKPQFLQDNYPNWLVSLIFKFPYAYVKYRELLCKKEGYVFKFMAYQLNQPRAFVHKLVRKGYKVVNIHRRDVIGVAISRCIAVQTNIWFVGNEETRTNQVLTIPVPDLLNTLEEITTYYNLREKVLNGLDYLSISYEDDLCRNDNHEYVSRSIANFASIPYELLQTISLPTDDRLDSERIENFNEIMDAIKASPYAHYLDNYIGDKH